MEKISGRIRNLLFICMLAAFLLCVGRANRVYAAPTGSTEGTAYAVLTDAGELIFFRSNDRYSAGAGQTVTDINGRCYAGRIYTDFERTRIYNLFGVKWYKESDLIISVRVADGQLIKPYDMSRWFQNFNNLLECNLTGFDTSNAIRMSMTFSGCRNLTSLDVSGFDTSKVESFDDMFYSCNKISFLDFSNWSTSSATDMEGMLGQCSSLRKIVLSEDIISVRLMLLNDYFFLVRR